MLLHRTCDLILRAQTSASTGSSCFLPCESASAENTDILCTSGYHASKPSLSLLSIIYLSVPIPPPTHTQQTHTPAKPQAKTNTSSIWGWREGLQCFFKPPNFQSPSHVRMDGKGANVKNRREGDRKIFILTALTEVF